MSEIVKSEREIVEKMLKKILQKLNKHIPNFDRLKCKEHVYYKTFTCITREFTNECEWMKGKQHILTVTKLRNLLN